MQIDRREGQCVCVVVGYDRRKAMHKVQWTVEASHDARLGEIMEDSVDFADCIVHGEIVHEHEQLTEEEDW
jgi:hypothetical protein